MRRADVLRYSLWTAVVGTALRNRKEYGVPTAWLTHLTANTCTLFLPEVVSLLLQRPLSEWPPALQPLLRTLERRVRQDPNYVGYVAPLALGFIASYPEYSIYHGRWAERNILGFGADSLPHASAAYGLARFSSEVLLTLHHELPDRHALVQPAAWAARHVDALGAAAVVVVTLIWEISEYLAHHAEVQATGRDPREVNMQWGWLDAITDSLSNLFGLVAAIAVRRSASTTGAASTMCSSPPAPNPPESERFEWPNEQERRPNDRQAIESKLEREVA